MGCLILKYELYQPLNPNYSVVQQILANRGISEQDMTHYLHTSDADICDYHLLDNLLEGATMLASHIARGSKILV